MMSLSRMLMLAVCIDIVHQRKLEEVGGYGLGSCHSLCTHRLKVYMYMKVTDVADALILNRLFRHLFNNGISEESVDSCFHFKSCSRQVVRRWIATGSFPAIYCHFEGMYGCDGMGCYFT